MTPAQDPSPESMAAARAYYESYGVDVRGLNWNISRMAEHFDAFAAKRVEAERLRCANQICPHAPLPDDRRHNGLDAVCCQKAWQLRHYGSTK